MIKLGLIGYPITHSLSPKLFCDHFKNRPDILKKYSYNLILSDDFDKAIDIFKKEYYAINVTTPFKEKAYQIADDRSAFCQWIMAANLLVLNDNLITAYNTDFFGVYNTLQDDIFLIPHCSAKVLVIGCGGAGKAAAAASLLFGLRTTIANRSISKCEEYSHHLASFRLCNEKIDHTSSLDDIAFEIKVADIIIYTIPVPLPGMDEIDFSDKTVLEANYAHPSFTKELIERNNIKYFPGTRWLEHQAEEAYRIVIP